MPSLSRVWALVGKDIREALPNRSVVLPTVFMPFIVAVGMPLLAIAGGSAGQGLMKLDPADAERLVSFYPVPSTLATSADRLLDVFLNHTFVPLFLVLPVISATLFAAQSVVGEKARAGASRPRRTGGTSQARRTEHACRKLGQRAPQQESA
jgi:ABC-2 type transport system permease protein